MKRSLLVLVATIVAGILVTPAFAQSRLEFKLGFKTLADLIPSVVGQPLENEHWGANGDSLQQTSTGLMVWRKADNWTAFTDGTSTWVNGPNGLQRRSNGERFDWEGSQLPTRESTPPFPQEIGNLARDGVMIRNMGSIMGIVDNKEDPENNWNAIVAAHRYISPEEPVLIVTYDNPDMVPTRPSYKYNNVVKYGSYPGALDGRQAKFKNDQGVWEWHFSLPIGIKSTDINSYNDDITSNVILFFVLKDDPLKNWDGDIGQFIGKQAKIPFDSGVMNFSLKLSVAPPIR